MGLTPLSLFLLSKDWVGEERRVGVLLKELTSSWDKKDAAPEKGIVRRKSHKGERTQAVVFRANLMMGRVFRQSEHVKKDRGVNPYTGSCSVLPLVVNSMLQKFAVIESGQT